MLTLGCVLNDILLSIGINDVSGVVIQSVSNSLPKPSLSGESWAVGLTLSGFAALGYLLLGAWGESITKDCPVSVREEVRPDCTVSVCEEVRLDCTVSVHEEVRPIGEAYGFEPSYVGYNSYGVLGEDGGLFLMQRLEEGYCGPNCVFSPAVLAWVLSLTISPLVLSSCYQLTWWSFFNSGFSMKVLHYVAGARSVMKTFESLCWGAQAGWEYLKLWGGRLIGDLTGWWKPDLNKSVELKNISRPHPLLRVFIWILAFIIFHDFYLTFF